MAKGWYGNRQAHSLASKGIKTSDIQNQNSYEHKEAGTLKRMVSMFIGIYTFPVRNKTLREIVYSWAKDDINSEEELQEAIQFLKDFKYIVDWKGDGKYWVIDSALMIADFSILRKDKERFLRRYKNRLGEEKYNYYREDIEDIMGDDDYNKS